VQATLSASLTAGTLSTFGYALDELVLAVHLPASVAIETTGAVVCGTHGSFVQQSKVRA
jgi:hypothetical protein